MAASASPQGLQAPLKIATPDWVVFFRLHFSALVGMRNVAQAKLLYGEHRLLWKNPSMEVSEIRRTNLLQLFSDYVAQRMADSPETQISGLDREFAAMIQVHNTYFSGMKSGARTVGEKLARQVESLCRKNQGWLDEFHESAKPADLVKFLRLAERAYLSAPAARKGLVKALRDAVSTGDHPLPKA